MILVSFELSDEFVVVRKHLLIVLLAMSCVLLVSFGLLFHVLKVIDGVVAKLRQFDDFRSHGRLISRLLRLDFGQVGDEDSGSLGLHSGIDDNFEVINKDQVLDHHFAVVSDGKGVIRIVLDSAYLRQVFPVVDKLGTSDFSGDCSRPKTSPLKCHEDVTVEDKGVVDVTIVVEAEVVVHDLCQVALVETEWQVHHDAPEFDAWDHAQLQ